jgi:hypothetical protein
MIILDQSTSTAKATQQLKRMIIFEASMEDLPCLMKIFVENRPMI